MLSLSDFRATATDVPVRFAAPFLSQEVSDLEGVDKFVFYAGDCYLMRDASGWMLNASGWMLEMYSDQYRFRDQWDGERDLYFYWYVWEINQPQSHDEMSALLDEYCGVYGLPPRCALEMLMFEDLSDRQRHWLQTFVEHWERLEEPRTVWAIYAVPATAKVVSDGERLVCGGFATAAAAMDAANEMQRNNVRLRYMVGEAQ